MFNIFKYRLFGAAILVVSLPALLWLAASAMAQENSSEISARIESQRAELQAAREELDQISVRIAEQEKTLEHNRMALADATTLLREAEDRYDESLDRFNSRISAIYKLGESRFYAVLLDSEDFNDALSRISYLGTISENDLKLIDRVKAEESQVRALREEVDGLKQAQADDVAVLKQRKSDLEYQIATGRSRMDASLLELAHAEAREQEEENRRLIEEALGESDNYELYGGVMGPSVTMGSAPPAGLQPTGIVLKGNASWYGPGFHGNRTANGEIYNMYAFTAAHKSLPFGTWLKVTYDGRSVFVRINDRGPYIAGRFLDLSAGSAQAIGLTGVGYVTAEIFR